MSGLWKLLLSNRNFYVVEEKVVDPVFDLFNILWRLMYNRKLLICGSPAYIIRPWTNKWLGSLGCCLVAQRSCLCLRDDPVQVRTRRTRHSRFSILIGSFSLPQPMRITFYRESARRTPRDFQSMKPELANMDSYPKVRVIRHCFAPTQCPKQLGCDKSQNKSNPFHGTCSFICD